MCFFSKVLLSSGDVFHWEMPLFSRIVFFSECFSPRMAFSFRHFACHSWWAEGFFFLLGREGLPFLCTLEERGF